MHDLDKGVVCVYGGDVVAIGPYIEWAQQTTERYIIWVEKEPYQDIPSSWDPVLRRVWQGAPFGYEEEFKKHVWECLFLPFHFLSFEEEGQHVLDTLKSLQRGVHVAASAYSDLGAVYMHNVLANMQCPTRPAHVLKDAFLGVPALICGAGPSLDPHSVGAFATQALTFACGSAIGPLARAGVTPHLTVAVDPDPPKERYTPSKAPLCYARGCAHHLVVGREALWVDDIGRYPLERWLYGCEDKEPLDGGWNAVTCGIALALMAGCSPIVLTGVDLSYVGDKRYAEGVLAVDNGPPPLDWLVAREWIVECMRKHPHVIWHSEKHLFPACSFDITDRLHALLKNTPPSMHSASTLKEHSDHASHALNKLVEGYASKAPFPEALWEDALEHNLVYEKFLCPLWDIWKHVFQRKSHDKIHRLLFLQRALTCLKNYS